MKDWERYLQQMFNHLKPGGYVELVEHLMDVCCDDGSYPAGCAMSQYMRHLNLALQQMGVPCVASRLRGLLINAGFVEVRVRLRSTIPAYGILAK